MSIFARLLVVAIMALAMGTSPAGAEEEPFTGRWDGATVKIYIDPNVYDNRWRINDAIGDWRDFDIVDITLVKEPCEGCITVSKVRPYKAEGIDVKWHGIAWAWAQGDLLVDCHIELSNRTPTHLRQGVLGHEIGHCLGLPHTQHPNSIMNLYNRPPTSFDWWRLHTLYNQEGTP